MNRENKRKTFEKGYYKTHACNDTFTCKVCGRVGTSLLYPSDSADELQRVIPGGRYTS